MDQSLLIRQLLAGNPALKQLLDQSQAQSTPEPTLTEDEQFFLKMFRGFLATEAGHPMAGMAAKFARYVQSEVDKTKV